MKSTTADPWTTGSEVFDDACQAETGDSSLSFEDSFVASSSDSLDDRPKDSTRLPDSDEYLASLENKLAKLKSKRKGKDMVKSLEEKNKSSMINFLADENRTALGDDDFILETPVISSHPLMRHVAPEKQALTVGELVELLKADQLAQVLEQQDSEEIMKAEERPN